MYPTFIPPTPEQLAELRAKTELMNEDRRRERVARTNRKRGLPEPRPGETLFVTTQRGIKRRSRAGVIFGDQAPVEVSVIDESDEQIAARQAAGESAVNVCGAEDILADTGPHGGLVLHGMPAARAIEAAKAQLEAQFDARLRETLADVDAAVAKERAEKADLAAQLEAMKRKLADATATENDGRPQRLAADKGKDKGKGE